MIPRTKIGHPGVDPRECANVIIGGCPEVFPANRGIASQIGYSAAHVGASEFTTHVVPANSTRMNTMETTSHVGATEFTTNVVSSNSTRMNAAKRTPHVASAKATYVATSEATHVASAKAPAAARIRCIDTKAAAQDCEC